MKIELNTKMLITTDAWFYAPDGENYRAVFGTVKGVHKDKETLGIETNKGSANWYVEIGNMFIAGCQIHYAIKTNKVSYKPPVNELEYEGEYSFAEASRTRIYNADEES